ncbi:MAG: g-D-glutamyl-meso-diaminopimelate peptidase [Bacillota bacterium]|nr:MAG: g-D-glutamyl-meso-diaminopimelate peptidase [Bacillota bacterium]
MRALFIICMTVLVVLLPIRSSIGYAPSAVSAAVGEPFITAKEIRIGADKFYTVDSLFQDLRKLTAQYPELKVEQVGKSYWGDPLYALVMGQGDKTLMVTAGMHGWESVGSYLSMREVAELLQSHAQGVPSASLALDEYRIVVLPLINPDGVRIAQGERHPLVGNYTAEQLRGWKANAWGVDINRNFPHGYYKMANFLPTTPGPSFYPGTAPASEKETQAVLIALETYKPDMLVDLHSSGNIVFWHYNQEQTLVPNRQLAYAVGKVFGYGISHNLQQAIGAHLKDHFIGTYDKPAFIVEIGSFDNRYQIHKEFNDLYRRFNNFLVKLAHLIP